MAEQRQAPQLPTISTPLIDPKTGLMTLAWYRYFGGERGGVRNVNSGAAEAIAELEAQLAAERTSRIAGDAVSPNGGSGTSNSGLIANGVSSGTTWVSICTVPVTPGGAGGDYTVTVTPDSYINGHLSDEASAVATFAGNWRIREEQTGGGVAFTLSSGTFLVTFTPESTIDFGEGGGGSITIPASWAVAFTGLPSGLLAANYAVPTDIRLEIQRASGSNNITAPGLSGPVRVAWTA